MWCIARGTYFLTKIGIVSIYTPNNMVPYSVFFLFARIIALRYGTNSGIQVSIQASPRKDFYTNNLVKDMKWQNLGGDFKEVRWEKMEGRNFINKMELLMASLTNI